MCCFFTPAAERDLEEIGDYIAMDGPARALLFAHQLRRPVRSLAAFPRPARSILTLRRTHGHGVWII